jgi:hypothetical protein
MSALRKEAAFAFERELHNQDDDEVIEETVVIAAECLDEDAHLSINDRPTIPVPAVPDARDSGVRLKIAHVEWPAATVDVVVCDLSRDPRSEDYSPERANSFTRRPRRARRLFAW